MLIVVALQLVASPPASAVFSTTVTVSSGGVDHPAVGVPVTFTATINRQNSVLTGTMSFTDNGSPMAGCQAVAVSYFDGYSSADCPMTFTAVGVNDIVAKYSGDADFGPSTSPALVQSVLLPSNTVIGTPSPPDPVYGQPVTVSATVSGSGPAPTGTVDFDWESGTLCSATVSGGIASCTLSQLPADESWGVNAEYSGDANYSDSSDSGDVDNQTTVDIAKAPTITTLSASANPVKATGPLSFTATVSVPAPGEGMPSSGALTFTANGVDIPGCEEMGIYYGSTPGSVTCSVRTPLDARGTIVAAFANDTDYGSSSSAPITETVESIPTSITALSSPTVGQPGQSIQYAAYISAAGGAPVNGTVTFMSGSTQLCQADVPPGSTVCRSSLAPIGSEPVSATFQDPTGTFLSSSTTFTMEVAPPNSPVVDIVPTPSGGGYWIVRADGAVSNFGDAPQLGSMLGQSLNKPIVAMAASPTGNGYWLVASDGGIFAFGDAAFYGSTGGIHLNQPIVGMAVAPRGNGYYLVAADGGVFAFGGAVFQGSMGATALNQPIVGIAVDDATGGYWMVAGDGGIFSFDAPFYGSTGAIRLNRPIVAMEAAPNGSGYRFVASDGGVFSFNQPFEGSMGGTPLNQPVVSMATDGGDGYWLAAKDGGLFAFSAPFLGSAN